MLKDLLISVEKGLGEIWIMRMLLEAWRTAGNTESHKECCSPAFTKPAGRERLL